MAITFEENYCFEHSATGEVFPKDKDNDARSLSTLETTLDNYILFTKAILQNSIINASTTKQMFSPQIKIRSIKQFGPLRLKDSTINDDIT